MKKKLSLLLCAALTATTLAGCGQAHSSPAGTDAGTEASAAGTAGSKEGERSYLCSDGGTGNTGPYTE